MPGGRSKERIRKTLSLPDELVEAIQKEADEKHEGDFTRATIHRLAQIYPEAAKFLRENETGKFRALENGKRRKQKR